MRGSYVHSQVPDQPVFPFKINNGPVHKILVLNASVCSVGSGKSVHMLRLPEPLLHTYTNFESIDIVDEGSDKIWTYLDL